MGAARVRTVAAHGRHGGGIGLRKGGGRWWCERWGRWLWFGRWMRVLVVGCDISICITLLAPASERASMCTAGL